MRKPTVLVTGRTSFLARHFIAAAHDRLSLTAVDRIDTTSLNGATFDIAVNFACDPSYYVNEYADAIDLDILLAGRLRSKVGHYVMLSSRTVYGRTECLSIGENREPDPRTPYARNKEETERRLRGDSRIPVTVLRLANVFGQEAGRRTFAGQALASLRDSGEIVLDIAPETRRDFLPADDFATALATLAMSPPGGVVNVGAGSPTCVGDIAGWFVEGFGEGCVRATDNRCRDEFCLDIAALTKIVGEVTSPNRIKEAAIMAGRGLKHA